jgi:Organic solute transporter Ostalpha
MYEDGYFAWDSSYVYLIIAYNISVGWCLYCLAMFYFTCSKDLKPYRPFPKFVCVKSIIFLTFWQGALTFNQRNCGRIDGICGYH